MKKFSRILSAILSVVLILGLVPLGQISVVAADVPVLSLNVVSETDTALVVSANLDSGSFLSIDMGLKVNSKNLTCTNAYESDEFFDFETAVKKTNNAAVAAAYKDTMKASAATSTPFEKAAPVFIFEFKKAAKDKTVKADIELVCYTLKDGKGNAVTPTIKNNLRTSATVLTAPTLKGSNVASTGKNKLEWNAVTGAVSYKVYRATSSTGSYSVVKTTTSLSYINTGAVAGKTYYYKVCAIDVDGNPGTFSAVVTRTCDYPRPTNVKVSGVSSTGKNKITWDAVEGATKYKVYRSTSADGEYTLMKTTTSLSYVNSSAVAGTKYYYKVKACGSKSAADSAYSSYVARTAHYARPVVSVSGEASTGKNKLSWNAVDGATSYEVYVATSKDGVYKLTATVKTTSYTHSAAVAGVKYYYKVKALGANATAESALSSYKCRTCDLATPVVTAGLSSKGKPQLSWSAVTGASSYRVYRATSKDGEYTLMKTTTATNYVNTSAVAGTTYYYKVKAVCSNSAADSAYTAVYSITSK